MTEQEDKHPGATGDRELPIVLVLDRDLVPHILLDCAHDLVDAEPPFNYEKWFHWTDTCGSRAVWYWAPEQDYQQATDLPEETFAVLETFVDSIWRPSGRECRICLRREDPGIGIYIPELDDAVMAAGEQPDGCIATDSPEGQILQTVVTELKRNELNRQHLEDSFND